MFFSKTLSIEQTTEECVPESDWHIFSIYRETAKTCYTLSDSAINNKSGRLNQWKNGKLTGWCWWDASLKMLSIELITEGHVPENDWHIFCYYRGMAKTLVFFTASRSHFYIQPEGLWQIMCQGFMMWDVIGPPSWWSKWMCISQTVTSTHLLRSIWERKPCCVAQSLDVFSVQPHVQLVQT